MSKRVFFSFHYQDVIDFRANVVRQHWQFKPDRESAGFFDASIWESAKKEGDIALKRLINSGLQNTSTTCVLIGTETHKRPWVRYEILKSFVKGNRLIGVHVNSVKGKDQKTKSLGLNPFSYVGASYSNDGKFMTLFEKNISGEWIEYEKIDGTARHSVNVGDNYKGKGFTLSSLSTTYDWVENDGYENFSTWVE